MGLCQAMLEILHLQKHEIALAFVSKNNTRSLQACQKMMMIVGVFNEFVNQIQASRAVAQIPTGNAAQKLVGRAGFEPATY